MLESKFFLYDVSSDEDYCHLDVYSNVRKNDYLDVFCCKEMNVLAISLLIRLLVKGVYVYTL